MQGPWYCDLKNKSETTTPDVQSLYFPNYNALDLATVLRSGLTVIPLLNL
jgi:hypothetical protein